MKLAAAFLLTLATLSAAGREVAITIDDLPRSRDGGPRTLGPVEAMTKRLLRPFREQHIPVIGFVNAGRAEELGPGGLRRILDLWLDAGAGLGNHTYSHPNLNEVPVDEYTADILKGEPAIREALAARGRKLTFFRHPFLYTGPTREIKSGVARFLDEHGRRVAPVTLDNSDWEFAKLYTHPGFRDRVKREYAPYMESIAAFFEQRSVEIFGREIPQVLLIHASEMNADLLPDLLAMFRRRGYTFVSLERALADPAYASPEEYVGRGGFSWIHRWSMTKGMKNKGEPDPPKWVEDGMAAIRR